LIQLDDKVLLHELLVSGRKRAPAYWPEGLILPQGAAELQKMPNVQCQWILKQRAGYGSHGNRILDTNDAVQLCSSTMTEECLLQRMVDPPMLLQRRKFTLRVYVVCLEDTSYLAKNGLVKLASVTYLTKTANSDGAMMNGRMHMTNSGREDDMPQYDFGFLQNELQQQGHSYDKVWSDLREAVSGVMTMYRDYAEKQQQSTYRSSLKLLGIPKILGLDFMLKADGTPQLLEVNRFPGLEPRGDGDRDVKVAVVHGAWALAAGRANCDLEVMLGVMPDDMGDIPQDLFEELTL
jgi:hypothetical protein